jgi:lysyl-tRNA synthetase class 2
MKPEKKADADPDEKFAALGIPAPWIDVIRKMGFKKAETLKEAKAGKLFNDLCGYNKKNKLGLDNPSMEDVSQWLA